MSSTLRIDDLDDDCLRLVVDELKDQYEHHNLEALHSFSVVCRRIREITSPVMFAQCLAPLDVDVRGFIPSTIWKYIRVLSLTEHHGQSGPYLRTDHLERAMPHFEILESVRFLNSWGSTIVLVIPAVLAAPRLRALHVINQVPDSEPSLSDSLQFSVVELRWTKYQWIYISDAHIPDEAALIRSLALPLRLSLRVLSLPVESTPIYELSKFVWPHLTDFSLTANRPSSTILLAIDFPSFISNMPRLTALSLMLPQSRSPSRLTIVFPKNSTTIPPLKYLQSLTLAYPNPEDLIFDHLPASLCHLSLTDCPRHYLSLDPPSGLRLYAYSAPIITSSELREIIQRCGTPALKSLEVVYQADTSEGETLDLIARKFSQLHTLKLFRYTSSADDPVDASLVASALSPLQELRHIFVHLNNPRAPHSRPKQPAEEQWAVTRFWDGLQHTADVFANAFAPQLDTIYLLERYYWSTHWTRWSVRYGDGDEEDGGVDGESGIRKEAYCVRVRDYKIPEQVEPRPRPR